MWRRRCGLLRGTRTSCTTSSGSAATCGRASTTRRSRRSSWPSGARSRCGSRASGGSRAAGGGARSRGSLPHWHGIDGRATLREALVPLQGLSLPVALWESDVLPRRVPGYQPMQLDALCASGEVVWVGAGLDRVALFFREDAPLLGRPAAAPPPEGEAHDAIRAALGRSAEFWYDLLAASGLEAELALPALWR